jgi:autotransporter-associated beta strand protein
VVGNTLTFGGTTPTLDITGTTLFLGRMAGSATVTKTGTGTFIHDSDNAAFTGTVVVDAGTFVNRATTVATTNFNPVSIVVNSGGTYQFGDNGAGNPNLPNNTYITLNAGGTVIWDEGEDFGGVNLNGGTLNLRAGGYNGQGAVAQEWASGTVTGNGSNAASGTGVSSTINKTTAGTVTIMGGARLNGTGGLNIFDGTVVLSTSTNLGTTSIALGGAGTNGALEYQGASAARGGAFGLNAGGGTVQVTTAGTTLTLSGVMSGAGGLTKTGPGALALTGANTYSGGTTISAGTL